MEDLYLTIKQLNSLFWDLTVDMLGLDPLDKATNNLVRISWQTDGAPAWLIDEDICFIKILFDDDNYNKIKELNYTDIEGDTDNINQSMSYTKVIRVMWTLYGPNSEDNSQTIRDKLFYQDIHDVLALQNIFMITDIIEPKRAPELYATRWWERVDIHVEFNELVIRNTIVPSINNVNIYTNAQAISGVITPSTPIPQDIFTESNISIET